MSNSTISSLSQALFNSLSTKSGEGLSELAGAREAIAFLKNPKQGIIDPNATLTILEISKTSPASLRLFDVTRKNDRPWIENPQVGNYYIVDKNNGYICSTGRAFPRPGTVKPLHVKHVEGPLSLEICLEDIYYLSTLAWTRPEDCSRYPITSRLNDRFLRDDATEYDTDALEFQAVLTEESDE
jgi:hypothetical protein